MKRRWIFSWLLALMMIVAHIVAAYAQDALTNPHERFAAPGTITST